MTEPLPTSAPAPLPEGTAAAEQAALQRAILDSLPDLVWMKDTNGVFLACNRRFEAFVGVTEAQIVGKTDHDLVDAQLADFFRENDLRAMARDAPTSNEELLHFASDGHAELSQTIKTPVRDAQGRLLGVLGISRDISALRRAEDEYRHLFDRNPAPMAIYARDSQRVVAVNDAFCALYGWSHAEALQLEVADLQVPERRDEARASIPQMQGLVAREWRHLRRDGSVMQVLVQSHDLERDGQACRVVVITDISRLHHNQQRDQSRLRLLDSLIRGDALEQQLSQLVLDHEAAFPGSLCSVLLLDEAGLHLQHGAAPSLPEFYNQAIHGLAIGPDVGACGAACHSGQRVVSENIATDLRWQAFRELARRAGLGACWSTPLLGAGGQVLGSFAVYRRMPARPEAEELDHASFAAGLAVLAIRQQRSAQRLQDSERRLADTLQAVPDPIWLKDGQGRLLLANAAYRRLTDDATAVPDGGDTGADVAAHNRAMLASDDDVAARNAAATTAERWLHLPPDGRRALFEVVTTPMLNAQGQGAGVLGVARDITLLKQGAQDLDDQSRLVDTMFSQTTDAIALVDPQTQGFVIFNDAACKGLGYSRAEFARLQLADLQLALPGAELQQRHAQAMTGETLTFDARHRRRDGGVQHAQMTLRRIDYAGRALLSVVWQDVSDSRRHASRIRRLAQEDQRLRAMLSLSQRAAALDEAALWQHGIDALVALVGSPCGSLHLVAPGSSQAGPALWASATPAALQPGRPDGPGALAMAGLCSQALAQQAAVVQRLPLAEVSPWVTAVPVSDQGRCVLVICVAHPADAAAAPPGLAQNLALAGADLWDIVQRRRTEIALQQAKAAADSASQAKSAFLANMSHEIRTPLNAVLGFAHLLQREPLSPRQRDHLGKIADASQHLLQVINDILDFSKIEASKLQLDPTDFALQPCLQRMTSMLADKARANRVELRLALDPASPALVHGDRMRLEQILLNLLSNAVKFTPGGRVLLRAGPLAPGWLCFEVSDTGIGIDAAQLPLLFQPFEQADASTTRRFGGTGLGLAICHRLAQLMGGRIGVQSRLGQGSRFWLELPLPTVAAPAPPALVAVSPAPSVGGPLQGLRVLLAEDNAINQEVAVELLRAQGLQVDVADDGQLALECAGRQHYDLVLMDVQMPRLDGLQATAAIRRLPGWSRIPIVAMTASAFPEDRDECLAAGMDDVLVKPVQPDALMRCLLQWRAAASQPAPAGPGPAPAAASLQHSLRVLQRLLQSQDTEAADHLARDAGLLQPAFGDDHASLVARVQGYAFAAALEQVDAVLARLGP